MGDTTSKSVQRIIVGLSGGVDSAVTALLLLEAGYAVEGLFMFNWDDDEAGRCQAAADFDDAARVCEQLGITLHRADFAREYKTRVFDYFLDGFRRGRTPNPDILCNREIKFSVFLDYARRLGADRIATGHYARLDVVDGATRLRRGVDPAKDQSYFLAGVARDALDVSLFPLGELQKSDVRRRARSAGLPVHAKRDSTGICFIGERDFEGFLRGYLGAAAGPIRVSGGPLGGRTLARHRGLAYYTIGQRRGLVLGGVAGASEQPWYVADKSLDDNTLWVTQDPMHPRLAATRLTTDSPHWLVTPPTTALRCHAQVRYRQAAIACHVEPRAEGLVVDFDEPPHAITPGQYVVFYDGDICLGCGEIATVESADDDRRSVA